MYPKFQTAKAIFMAAQSGFVSEIDKSDVFSYDEVG